MQSTIYTIGTALNRARDHGVVVHVLVAGHWVEGLVSDVDGHGVVLTGSGADHYVVRIEDIAAVRVHAEGPLDDVLPAYPPDAPQTYIQETARTRLSIS